MKNLASNNVGNDLRDQHGTQILDIIDEKWRRRWEELGPRAARRRSGVTSPVSGSTSGSISIIQTCRCSGLVASSTSAATSSSGHDAVVGSELGLERDIDQALDGDAGELLARLWTIGPAPGLAADIRPLGATSGCAARCSRAGTTRS